jgi:cyclopropane-fatty-acyl-phospholipid synthase
MNESTATVTTAAGMTGEAAGFHQRHALRALSRMTAGCLRLEMPDGTPRIIGTPGSEVSATIRVRHPAFFQKIVLFGDVGFGESYVDGDWDTDSIERVIAWAIHNLENTAALSGSKIRSLSLNMLRSWNRAQHLLRPNSKTTARPNIAEHYDLGNEFYALWLDPTMTYSSALFASPHHSLKEAQEAKYEALCQELKLHPGDHLLEIGTGWGGFACHAARHHGCRVTTVTISQRQFDFARDRIAREGLAGRIDLRLQDYRDIDGTYDKIASIEMMEALGDRYLETFFAKIHEVLAPHGLVALQYITVPDARHAQMKRGVDWIQKHIFPGSLLLSLGRVNQALHQTGDLFLHRLSDLGLDYARTLREWHTTFNTKMEDVRALGFDDRFIRKWNYYLQYCEAAFAMRNISVVHATYTRPNNPLLRARACPPPAP